MLKIVLEVVAYGIIGRIILIGFGISLVINICMRLEESDIPFPDVSIYEGYFVTRVNTVILGNYYKWIQNGVESGSMNSIMVYCADILDFLIWPILVILIIISRQRIVDGWVYIAMMDQYQG